MLLAGKRKWFVFGVVLFLILTACVAGLNVSFLKTQYAAHQLRAATNDEDRARAANQLVNLGTPGLTKLIEFIQSGNDSCRSVSTTALNGYLSGMPDGDRRAVPVAGQLLDTFSRMDESGRKAVLALMSNILKRTGNTYAAKCREAIAAGLKTADTDTRVLAIRLALHPDANMRAELLPLMNDPEPRVRGAALFGVATTTDGEQVLADEDLFHWLHDPDEGVRKVCRDALVSRDRSESEINLARRLSHPDAGERLKLLYDLRYEDDVIDPEPWLERLSRDRDPALRAGAARVILEVIAERKLSCPLWVARVSTSDPDPTVRRIATFFCKAFTKQPGEVRQAGAP
jgi:hypothetical protein